jgi:phage terminase small subunit
MELSKRRKDFCRYRAEGYSVEQSAIKAGYSKAYAKTTAGRLLDNCKVKSEIERLTIKKQEIIEKKFAYTIEDSFKELEEIRKLAMCPDGETGRLNLPAATKAIELKGKLMQLYVEKVENTVKGTGLIIQVKP